MSQQFNEIRVGNSARSTFDLSHHQVTTSDFGYLIPICVRDLVPNDDVVVTPHLFCRLAPMAYPAYGRITCRVHSFFVPYRILYPKWSEFITQSPSNNTIPPYFTVSTLRSALGVDPQFSTGQTLTLPRGIYGRVMANLGLNPDIINPTAFIPGTERISAFRWLAYYRIWLDWFMDSNLNDHSSMVAAFNDTIKDGGSMVAQATDFLRFRNACFGKDYFTTAKLHPQASEDPSLVGVDLANPELNPKLYSTSTSVQSIQKKGTDSTVFVNSQASGSTSKIGQFTVEELRAATSLQRYLERNNYVGTKVINQLLVHFGIAPTPERLDMSEFLGGSNFGVQIGDVTSTTPAESDTQSPITIGLGAQAGKGIAGATTETVRYHAKEHGVFMTLLSIIPDTAYYQGIPKVMQLGVTGDALDYYTPEFENLGFQEILNKEVYVPNDGDQGTYDTYDPDGIFGYAPRYAFLKWQQDILAGDFLGNLSSSAVMGSRMDAWHLFRTLAYDDDNPLALNDNFVECDNHNNDFDRIFQVTSRQLDHFYFNIDVDFKSTRNMVGFAEPSLDSVNMEDGNKINLPYGGTRL